MEGGAVEFDDEWSQWIAVDESVIMRNRSDSAGANSSVVRDRGHSSYSEAGYSTQNSTSGSYMNQPRRESGSDNEIILQNSDRISGAGSEDCQRRKRNESDSSSGSASSTQPGLRRVKSHATRRRSSTAGRVLSPKNEALLLKIMEVNNLNCKQTLERQPEVEPAKFKKSKSLTSMVRRFTSSRKLSSSTNR